MPTKCYGAAETSPGGTVEGGVGVGVAGSAGGLPRAGIAEKESRPAWRTAFLQLGRAFDQRSALDAWIHLRDTPSMKRLHSDRAHQGVVGTSGSTAIAGSVETADSSGVAGSSHTRNSTGIAGARAPQEVLGLRAASEQRTAQPSPAARVAGAAWRSRAASEPRAVSQSPGAPRRVEASRWPVVRRRSGVSGWSPVHSPSQRRRCRLYRMRGVPAMPPMHRVRRVYRLRGHQ